MLKVLILMFISLSFSTHAEDCRPSIYEYKGKPLCFSMKYKSYFTQDCAKGECGAYKIMDQAAMTNIPAKAGTKKCESLGGTTILISSPKVPDPLCFCVAKDQSGVSCSKLGQR